MRVVPGIEVAVAVAVAVRLADAVGVAVAVGLGVVVGRGVAVAVAVIPNVGVGEFVAVAVGVGAPGGKPRTSKASTQTHGAWPRVSAWPSTSTRTVCVPGFRFLMPKIGYCPCSVAL